MGSANVFALTWCNLLTKSSLLLALLFLHLGPNEVAFCFRGSGTKFFNLHNFELCFNNHHLVDTTTTNGPGFPAHDLLYFV